MLHNLDIWSSKNRNLELSDLTRVNYLVGDNGSGKTRVIEALHRKNHNHCVFLPGQELSELVEHSIIPTLPKSTKFIVIKEPENGLYPKLQKSIPKKLDALSRHNSGLQIFVTTNSPFVIAAVAELTQTEKEDCECSKHVFNPSQKVYILKEGKIAHKSGELKLDTDKAPKGRFGYWGKKANFIASQMLSSGLYKNDSILTKNNTTPDAPILVLCEGSDAEADALIYNKIFENYLGRSVLFVSCQGTHELSTSFDVFRQVKNSLSANFKLLMLRDRDHDFRNQNSIDNYIENYPDRRVLYRRAIECYLYSSETAELILAGIGETLTSHNKRLLDNLQNQIQYQAENGVPGNVYKEDLKMLFARATAKYQYKIDSTQSEDPKFKFSVNVIAPLITPDTNTYKELAQCIFWDI